MSSAPIADAAARTRIVSELDRNLLVEAGQVWQDAELAERMAAGIACGTYDLEGLAAVTFTRKAAAELRGRFQLALEAELSHAKSSDDENRLRSALSSLERFFAGTIHAFCARLLRERPVEAGVAPGFTELDDGERCSGVSWRLSSAAKAFDPICSSRWTPHRRPCTDRRSETICLYEDVTFPGRRALRRGLSAWNALEVLVSLQRLRPRRSP
jgi:hypothetical protein